MTIIKRRPTMAEQQAVTAFKDAVRRMRLRGLDVVTTRDGDTLRLQVFTPAPTRSRVVPSASTQFPGIEGVDGPIKDCFDSATRWLEEREAEFIGVPVRLGIQDHPIPDISTIKEDGGPDHQAIIRSLMRFHDDVWISLDAAYLHRIFMWPDVASQQPNRHERRKWEASR